VQLLACALGNPPQTVGDVAGNTQGGFQSTSHAAVLSPRYLNLTLHPPGAPMWVPVHRRYKARPGVLAPFPAPLKINLKRQVEVLNVEHDFTPLGAGRHADIGAL
jgi:hypothetical protein